MIKAPVVQRLPRTLRLRLLLFQADGAFGKEEQHEGDDEQNHVMKMVIMMLMTTSCQKEIWSTGEATSKTGSFGVYLGWRSQGLYLERFFRHGTGDPTIWALEAVSSGTDTANQHIGHLKEALCAEPVHTNLPPHLQQVDTSAPFLVSPKYYGILYRRTLAGVPKILRHPL